LAPNPFSGRAYPTVAHSLCMMTRLPGYGRNGEESSFSMPSALPAFSTASGRYPSAIANEPATFAPRLPGGRPAFSWLPRISRGRRDG
jgi:hypothetical protein